MIRKKANKKGEVAFGNLKPVTCCCTTISVQIMVTDKKQKRNLGLISASDQVISVVISTIFA